MLEITASIFSAKGRAASAALCARRSFDAATICMALVIFCVALVEAMRTRMSLRDAILYLTLTIRPLSGPQTPFRRVRLVPDIDALYRDARLQTGEWPGRARPTTEFK